MVAVLRISKQAQPKQNPQRMIGRTLLQRGKDIPVALKMKLFQWDPSVDHTVMWNWLETITLTSQRKLSYFRPSAFQLIIAVVHGEVVARAKLNCAGRAGKLGAIGPPWQSVLNLLGWNSLKWKKVS